MGTNADIQFKPGDKVDGRWQVIKKLGQGAFAAVYEVKDTQGKYKGSNALKLESLSSNDQFLKVEVAVLQAMKGTTNVCHLNAYGKTDRLLFLVMTLVGPSISTLRKRTPNENFSLPTTMMVTCQCLQALKDMHTVGWVHRDVKPSNFCIGQRNPKSKRTIFVLDFGLSRYIFDNNKAMKKPRSNVGFRGTLRYCSLNAHKGLELGRHDDLISLLYMMVELLKGNLPWKNISNLKEVELEKTKTAESLYKDFPAKFKELHKNLHSLVFDDTPPYDNIKQVIYQVVPKSEMEKKPFDWELTEKQKGTSTEMEREGSAFVNTGDKDNGDNEPVAEV